MKKLHEGGGGGGVNLNWQFGKAYIRETGYRVNFFVAEFRATHFFVPNEAR